MSEAKFTNGPWNCEYDDSTSSIIQVFSESEEVKGNPDICRLQHEPDAHLISTAPEMYEALNEISSYSKVNGDYLLPFSVDDIEKLLAKARGEQ